MIRSNYFKTDDGVRLHFLEAGSGPEVLLVHGWTLCAELWSAQVEELAHDHHVIAVDLRGHGRSDSPAYGYRIQRLASDVHSLIESLQLQDIAWVGHSMGCSVAWAYLEQHGAARLRRLVLIDEAASVAVQPHWSGTHAAQSGAVFELEKLREVVAQMIGAQATAVRRSLLEQMWTDEFPKLLREKVTQHSLRVSDAIASKLLFDHATNDWSDLLPTIDLPTLVIGCRASIFPVAAAEYVAHLMPRSQLQIFERAQGGSHLLFLENPSAVSRLIREHVV